ncbi:MAG TPA: MBL fold metallo-hydrolase [Dehalococcoidia bacterium]|nr:MBL fold metallo-hydrolase [Dehalococcoidia bacterium]
MRLSATFKVGNVSVAALSDAATEMPLPGFFDEVPDEEWTSALGIDTPGTSVPFNFGSFLLRGSGRTVLLDTGFGEQGPYAEAKGAAGLLDRIRDLGVGLDEIDAVIHTHLHFDHVGWNTVTEGGERVPTFRNAVWRVSEEEINWWDGGAAQPHPDYEHILRDVFDPIVEYGKVESFSGEILVEPFLTSIPTPGHTPGHTSFLLSSAGEHLLLVGDAAHHPEHLVHHDWVPAVDNDPRETTRSRRRIVDLAIEKDAMVTGGHFPILTIGKLSEIDNAIKFTEVEIKETEEF